MCVHPWIPEIQPMRSCRYLSDFVSSGHIALFGPSHLLLTSFLSPLSIPPWLNSIFCELSHPPPSPNSGAERGRINRTDYKFSPILQITDSNHQKQRDQQGQATRSQLMNHQLEVSDASEMLHARESEERDSARKQNGRVLPISSIPGCDLNTRSIQAQILRADSERLSGPALIWFINQSQKIFTNREMKPAWGSPHPLCNNYKVQTGLPLSH